MQREKLFWIWLAEALGAANKEFGNLIGMYETPYDIFLAEEAELERLDGLSPRTVSALANKDLQRATEILEACERQNIGILTYDDERYPKAFGDLKDPPILLYYKGILPDLSGRLSIGMVGMRKMSEYGLHSAYRIAYELASAGVVVVSGMAEGIDGVCAAAALAAKGQTIAIFGCGVDVIYPRFHKKLSNAILQNGAILSEYPPGTRPIKFHFPTRNRLIAGITQGTVVVEAGIGSGSLITAKVAVSQGKDVFALPANVGSSGAEGTNGLLRDGAKPILGARDVLEPYLYSYAETLNLEALSKVGKTSQTDMRYLNELGVIELLPTDGKKAFRTPASRESDPPTKPRNNRNCKSDLEEVAKSVPEREPVAKQPPMPADRETPDKMLSSLSPVQLAVMQAIPDDHGVTADALANLGYPYPEIVSALTMLEILGLIQKLPGAIYAKI